MSTLPSPAQVAGAHLPIYEAYYKLVDPKNYGQVGAMDAAKFLKKSHLSDIILSKIWDISDPSSRGFLDKPGMFVALKLCAMAQQGHNLDIKNICMDLLPPKMGDVKISISTQPPATPAPLITSSVWSISPAERAKYEQLFRSLEPIDGYIPGNKVKGLLMDSKLPLDTLGKIWDLADIDKDGKLNQHEFTVAMHLVYKTLEKNTVPNVLPPELMEGNAMRGAPLPVAVAVPELIPSTTPLPVPSMEMKPSDWVVSYEDLKAANQLFTQADKDLDGFVSGLEIKDVFIQSGLSQSVLAHIWGLCDVTQSGKLNNEQFALAMWLIKKKLNGIELPGKLSPEMMPPSLRKKRSESITESQNVCTYSNPELDMISKDISEIIREKHVMEQDISQKEADIKIKSGEIKSLQSELDTLAATLRQLDNQKGEAQKRLNDLKVQVDKLRQQATDQEATLHVQEEELHSKRQEVECLKQEEQSLEAEQHKYKDELNGLSKQLQNIQLQISQTKANMTQLEEQQRQIVDAITQFDTAFALGDASVIPDSALLFKVSLDKLSDITNTMNNKSRKDIFNINKASSDENSFEAFNSNDSFQRNDRDPFQDSQAKSQTADPFNPTDKKFDPFNDGSMHKGFATDFAPAKDPFGEDPFAALHAPVRSESPSPALPPKKSKQPPPRPAPPRPAQMQQPPAAAHQVSAIISGSDPFADNGFSAGDSSGFANFANFDTN